MKINGLLQQFPRPIKLFIGSFVVILSFGYFTGLLFVTETSANSPTGIEENYLGNEDDEEAEVMKFRKSSREMLTIVHTHVLSMSFIFFLLGIVVWLTSIPTSWKLFLTVEPFLSVILTFGGIYLLWSGIYWMKYIIIFSGILMTTTFSISIVLVLFQLTLKPKN